jgi:pimeloyl-ACP methyl ester carboxylesterase
MADRVVLLHSSIGDSRLWRHQVPVLAERFDVVTPDLPGWGETPLPHSPFSFVEIVSELLPAALVGNSMGGMIALRTALASPGRVDKLVLIGAGLPAWDWSEEMRSYWGEEDAAFQAGRLAEATEINLAFWVRPDLWDEVRPQQLRAFELAADHAEPEVLWPEMSDLSSLDVPTLVVCGDADKPDFLAISRHLAEQIPNAELVFLEGAGHLAGLDRPDELNELLLEFLTR